MAETTGIAWTDSTFNPWIGCTKVSPGCDHCYAAVSTPARTMGIVWGPRAPRQRTSADNWQLPHRWNAQHDEFFAKHGRKRRVFCASLADVFDNEVDPAWRKALWTVVKNTPNLDWLILTKRIGNVAGMLPDDWGDYANGYPNVWLGITVVNQAEADRDIHKLLRIPAALWWLSMEPLLEDVSFEGLYAEHHDPRVHLNVLELLDWVVVGGESGQHARPMNPAWVESLRAQCEATDTAFFFKQWGGKGKDKGGCLLNDIEVKSWPAVA